MSLKYKITYREIFYLICFFILLEPRYFFYVPFLNKVFKILICMVSGFLMTLYIFKYKTHSKTTLLIMLYHFYLCIVTIINNGEITTAILDTCIFVGLSICTERILKYKPSFLYTKLLFMLSIEIFINFLSIIIFPNGLYSTVFFHRNYFLGYDNQMINIIIPTIAFIFLYLDFQNSWFCWPCFVVSIISIATVLLIWSGASLVIIAIITVLVFTGLINVTRIFNMKNYLLVNLICFISIVILRMQYFFKNIIVNILGKNLTFSGRTYIWDRVIHFIVLNPIFGYGIENSTDRSAKMALASYYGVSNRLTGFSGLHAHNRFLETTYRGGIILLLIYMSILLIATYYLVKFKDSFCSKILSVVIFAYLTGMLTEYYRFSYMFFPFMVMSENISLLNKLMQSENIGHYKPKQGT